jgi:hypothetical protein
MVLQDHGFGGNWMNFGDKQGPLYQLAAQSGLPDWLLVADNTKYWSGFQVASDWSLAAGSAGHKRRLWRRTSLK